MQNYSIRISVPDGEVKRILDELTKAQETIYKCYNKLQELGVVTISEAAGKQLAAGEFA